jgi:hypothetical protein
MAEEIKCPACHQPLYLPASSACYEDSVIVICRSCHFKYAVSYAIAQSCSSELVSLSAHTIIRKTRQQRLYKLRVSTKLESTQTIQFTGFDLEEKFTAIEGNLLILLYTLNKQNVLDLIWIKNSNNNCCYQLFSPKKQEISKGIQTTSITIIGGSVLALIDYIYPVITNHNLFFGAIPLALITGFYGSVHYRQKYRELAVNNLARLTSEQNILSRLYTLKQRIEQLNQNKTSEERLLNRFKILQEKMSHTDANLYCDRLRTINRGISALAQQVNISQNLIDGYSQLIDIWEIEYETSQLAEQLPGKENVEEQVLPRLEELEALEEQKEELSLLIQPAAIL